MIFRKRISLFKGFYANLSKKGIGFSYGIRGARIGVNRKGIYYSTGIPGSGIFHIKYIKRFNKK